MPEDTFREIEKAHEARYKLDEELRFKARARRCKLLGLWAAERMGIAADPAADYAKGLVALSLQDGGLGVVVERIVADFARRGVVLEAAEVEAAAERFYAEALEQLKDTFPTALGPDHTQVGG